MTIDTKELRQNITTYGLEATCTDDLIGLLDRLEEAEKAWKINDQTVYDLTEKVIPNIQEKLEAAEKELVEIRHGAAVANDTIKALQAKIEQMEQQKPVVEVQWAAYIPNGILDFISTDGYLPKLGDKLYALPGAKGEEK